VKFDKVGLLPMTDGGDHDALCAVMQCFMAVAPMKEFYINKKYEEELKTEVALAHEAHHKKRQYLFSNELRRVYLKMFSTQIHLDYDNISLQRIEALWRHKYGLTSFRNVKLNVLQMLKQLSRELGPTQQAYTEAADDDDLIKNTFWMLKIKKEKCLGKKRHVVKKQ
jgi:hypothetical protein